MTLEAVPPSIHSDVAVLTPLHTLDLLWVFICLAALVFWWKMALYCNVDYGFKAVL